MRNPNLTVELLIKTLEYKPWNGGVFWAYHITYKNSWASLGFIREIIKRWEMFQPGLIAKW